MILKYYSMTEMFIVHLKADVKVSIIYTTFARNKKMKTKEKELKTKHRYSSEDMVIVKGLWSQSGDG